MVIGKRYMEQRLTSKEKLNETPLAQIKENKMKNIKEMIIPILLGFTLVVSVYSSVKVIQNEKKINQNWDYIQEIGEKLNKEIE